MMNDLTERNQRRERIADNRQAHRAEPLTRQCSELKGQRPNPRHARRLPNLPDSAHVTRIGTENAVVPITSCDRSSHGLRIDPAGRALEIIFRAGHRLRIPLAFIRRTERRPAKCGRAQIAEARPCPPSLHRSWRDTTANPGHEK